MDRTQRRWSYFLQSLCQFGFESENWCFTRVCCDFDSEMARGKGIPILGLTNWHCPRMELISERERDFERIVSKLSVGYPN